MTRVLKGLVALVGLAAIVAGVPLFLITIGGNPLPDRWPGVGELGDILTSQDTGQVFLGFLLWVAWIAWAYFTVSMLVELAAQLTRRSWRLPVFGGGQRITAGLVTAVIALFVAPTFATAASAAVDHSPASPPTTITSTHPGSTQTSAAQHSEPAASQPPAASHAAPAAAPVKHSAPAQPTTKPYTVKADDTLWGIAEREYGDGLKYRSIAAANPHITDIHDIEPGQVIQLPIAPTAKPAAPAGDYTVKKGDTLSEIAEDQLGNAQAWPAIAKANQGQQQPDGGHLTDPDLIQPGWHLTLPAANAKPAEQEPKQQVQPSEPKKVEQGKKVTPPASQKPVKPATPTQQPTARPTAEPTATAQPTQTEVTPEATATPSAQQSQPPATVTPQATDRGESPPQVIQPTLVSAETEPQVVQAGFPIRTAGGAGVLLAAGLVALLTARKTLQLLHRRPGQAIPAPPAETRTTEAQLRTVAEPLTADRLNLVLRALASALDDADRSLPQLVSVHMSDSSIELRLRAPDHNPPAPFSAGLGAGSWVISIDDVDQLLQSTEVLETMPAPWPTLVTIGHDRQSAHVLVDLEQTAALAITTPNPDVARAVLAAISVELATSTWADDLRVTIVGDLEDLANALGAGRIRYIDGATNLLAALQRRADRHRDHLVEAGHASLGDARLDPDSADALTPEVVLIATDLTDDERARLTELVTSLPRVAVAAVTATGDPLTEWNLRITDPKQATLDPIGLELQPQMLGGPEYDSVIKLLRAAARTDTEPADWWDHDLDEATAADQPEPSAAVVSISPSPIVAADKTADQERQDAEVTHLHAPLDVPQFPPTGPWLQMLGPVEIHGATGTIEQKRSEVCRRLAVFLALHPNGTPGTVIDDTLVITSSYRLSVLSRLRSWLGEAPDGDEYLPAAVGKKYRLHPDFRSDWDHFNELTKSGINASPTRNLVEALKLVKGRPMSSGTPQLYSWASYHSDQISAKIRDTALLVAERSLEAHDVSQARWAITTAYQAGLQHDEFLARAELRVERAAGNTDGIRAVVDRLNQTVRDLDIDLDPETLELMTEIEQARRRNHA